MHVCIYVSMYVRMYVRMHVCVRACVRGWVGVSVCPCVCLDIICDMNIYVFNYNICIYVHVFISADPCWSGASEIPKGCLFVCLRHCSCPFPVKKH